MWESFFYWLAVYLLVGLLCGLTLSIHRFVMEHRPQDFDWTREIKSWARYFKFANWNRRTVTQELRGIWGIMWVWPLLPPAIVWDLTRPKYERAMFRFQNNPADQFKCQSTHLTRRVSPEQAEVENFHHDPLGKVPAVPFGHMHTGWIEFLSEKLPELSLWEFEIPEDSDDISKRLEKNAPMHYQLKGYALAKGKSVRAEFFTEWN